jgi:hypothetical protein
MTTYNVATESAEKLALRVNSKGGSSAMEGEAGVYLLKPPASVVYTGSGTGGTVAANTYYYYVTRVTNGVESFSAPAVAITTSGSTSSATFAITDQTTSPTQPLAASSFNLYVGTTAANATKQTVTGTTTLSWTAYTTNGTAYSASPAVVAYPEAANAFSAYEAPSWVTDAVVHNPNAGNSYSGYPVAGAETQVRQIRTSVVESQLYSRTDTATVTSGSGTVTDSSITWADFGKPVTGTGIPTNAYVGTVTPGTSFVLSSVQGQNVPYWPGTTNAFNATANGTSITVTGSNVGPSPVQVGQYRTTRWQG